MTTIAITVIKPHLEQSAIEFNSWKYERYLEFIWSELKNTEVGWTLCAENKMTIFEIAKFALH